jgi:hypothetical protein
VTLDTGVKGAMVLFENGQPIEGHTFVRMGQGIDPFRIVQALKRWRADNIYIEAISARPYQGVKATATQFFIVGQCHTIAQLNFETVEYINPRTWSSFTKRLSVTPAATSKEIAQELGYKYYADFSSKYASKRNKIIHDGIADCLAINLYINRDIYVDDVIP